jgi:uncharacterized protein YaeQ
MAIKATIYKVQLQLADMDRNVYADTSITIARHPSESDERMMIRVLALALSWPADTSEGTIELAKDMWEPDEPALWQKNYSGEIVHWVEMGQPDEKRLMKASGRAQKVSVWAYQHSTPIWWDGISSKLSRARNITVLQIPNNDSQNLAKLVERTMQLQISVQDGTVWINDGSQSVEITPIPLMRENQ